MPEANWEERPLDEDLLTRRRAALEMLRNATGTAVPGGVESEILHVLSPGEGQPELWELHSRFGGDEVRSYAQNFPFSLQPVAVAARRADEDGPWRVWFSDPVRSEYEAVKQARQRAPEGEANWPPVLGKVIEHRLGSAAVQDETSPHFRYPASKDLPVEAYRPKAAPVDAEWTPASIDRESLNPEYRALFDVMLANIDRDLEAVRDRALKDRLRRTNSNPWREVIVDGKPNRAESRLSKRFLSLAEQTLFGFPPIKPGDEVQARAKALPFYREGELIDMVDRRAGHPRQAKFVLARAPAGGDEIRPVTWKSRLFHDLNSEQTLQIRGEDAVAYVELFCPHLTAEEGTFRIVESVDDLRWIGVDPAPRRKIAELIQPMMLWNRDGEPAPIGEREHCFFVSAHVVYGVSLFRALFVLQTTGEITMMNDSDVYLNLPVTADKILEKTTFVYVRRW